MYKQRNLLIVILVITSILLITNITKAANEADKQQAIDDGLAYLASIQQSDGRWNYGDDNYDIAATGAALLAFIEEGHTPTSATLYSDDVNDGLEFLFNYAQTYPISAQPAGNPDFNGNGIGVKFNYYATNNSRDIYCTGLAIMPIAAVGTPEAVVPVGPQAGRTYADVIQDVVDYFAYAQNEGGWPRGGWRYYANYGSSDNSTSQWPIIGLLYAQSAGATIPGFIATELPYWVTYIQNPGDGGSYYDNNFGSWGSNVSRTGTLLAQQTFLGLDTTDPNVQSALNYLNNQWQTIANLTWNGNFGHPYAMWAAYKGLQLAIGVDADQSIISNLHDPCDIDNPNHGWNWWEDYCEWLVTNQNDDGSWYGYTSNWTSPLASAWYINILAATEIPPLNNPPECNEAFADLNCLWPPNHKFVEINILGVTDPDGDPVTITITGITSDEPTASDEGAGGAKHAPDASGVGTDSAYLRVERSGDGNGRVYEISFTATDDKGAECVGSVIVNVPHDQSDEDCTCIDDGQNYDATQIN